MKILHLFGPVNLPRQPEIEACSGVVWNTLQLAKIQKQRGHEVTIAAPSTVSWQAHWRSIKLVGISHQSWARTRVGHHSLDMRQPLANMLYTLSHRFDIVHTHKESYVRCLAGGARIVHADSDPLVHPGGVVSTAAQQADFTTINRFADAIVAVSQYVARQYQVAYPFTIPIHVVNNGVDTHQFDASQYLLQRLHWRQQWHVTSDDDPVFLYCGALIEQKGVLNLVQAFAHLHQALPEAHLVIVGSGALWTGRPVADGVLQDIARQSSCTSHIHLLGAYGHRVLPQIYAAIDVVVVPSMLPEASPLVILEAMASTKPIIASDVGGIPELVRNIGTLVPVGSIEALSEAMKRLALNPELRRAQGTLGRRVSLSRTWDKNEQSIRTIYRELLYRTRPRRLTELIRRRMGAGDTGCK